MGERKAIILIFDSHLSSSVIFVILDASDLPILSVSFPSSPLDSSAVFTLSLSKTLLNRLDHLITPASSLREARSKVRLYLFELAAVAIHVAKGDAFRPILLRKERLAGNSEGTRI